MSTFADPIAYLNNDETGSGITDQSIYDHPLSYFGGLKIGRGTYDDYYIGVDDSDIANPKLVFGDHNNLRYAMPMCNAGNYSHGDILIWNNDTKCVTSVSTLDFSDLSNTAHNHDWADIQNKPPQATRWPSWTEINDAPTFDPVQSDWNETDTGDPSYIENKPDVVEFELLSFDYIDFIHITGITGETTKIIPPLYKITNITIKETGSNSAGNISIGLSSGGTEVVNSRPVGANELVNCGIGKNFFSKTGDTTLYITSDSWGTGIIDIDFRIEKIKG